LVWVERLEIKKDEKANLAAHSLLKRDENQSGPLLPSKS
jgi:hypothetical protein